jgi:hypothetical protein
VLGLNEADGEANVYRRFESSTREDKRWN